LIGLLLLCVTVTYARGNKEKKTPAQVPEIVQVSGVVRLVGSGVFTELVITGSGGEWYIPRDETYKLHDLQQQTVTVEGEETVTELKGANDFIVIKRRELKNVRILSVG
jgi:hypothetical protein